MISVIMPTYNYGKYLPHAVDSVLNQIGVDFELIVVDDGSTDNSSEILQSYGKRIRVFTQYHKGAPTARNLGIEKAKGDYIAFLDSDDWLTADSLSVRLSYLENHPEYDWIYGNWNIVDFKENFIATATHFFLPPPEHRTGYLFNSLLKGTNFITIFTPLIKKKQLIDIGGFRSELEALQDYDLWLRLSRKYKAGFLDQVLAYQRIHKSHISYTAEKRYITHLQILHEYMNDKEAKKILKPVYAKRVSNIHNYLCAIRAVSGKRKKSFQSCMASILANPVQMLAYKFLWYLFTKNLDKIKSSMTNKTINLYDNIPG